MSNEAPRRVTPAMVKRETKKLNREKARARRAAARRRRQYGIVAASAVVVVLLIVGVVLLFGGKPHKTTSASASASASSSASAGACPSAAPAAQPTGAFPQLPSGADKALATKPTVAAPSGSVTDLKVTTLIAGTGAAVQKCQTVQVNYVGVSYKDGKEFDSSWKNSQTFSFQVGNNQVIKGWDQGLVGVKVGSRVQLDIPSALGYGDGDQPTNGPLRFVVDVLAAS